MAFARALVTGSCLPPLNSAFHCDWAHLLLFPRLVAPRRSRAEQHSSPRLNRPGVEPANHSSVNLIDGDDDDPLVLSTDEEHGTRATIGYSRVFRAELRGESRTQVRDAAPRHGQERDNRTRPAKATNSEEQELNRTCCCLATLKGRGSGGEGSSAFVQPSRIVVPPLLSSCPPLLPASLSLLRRCWCLLIITFLLPISCIVAQLNAMG